MGRKTTILLVTMILVSIAFNTPVVSQEARNLAPFQADSYSTWTVVDGSNFTVEVLGEDIGSQQSTSFAGWYTDSIVVDSSNNVIVTAWIREDVDSSGNDQIYIGFFKFDDIDGDGSPEAVGKTIKLVYTGNVVSLDSLVIGDVSGAKRVLVTWTYYDSTEKNNVAGAVYDVDGTFEWTGNIRSTTAYEEYSRACYVYAYNQENGGFLIVWFTGYDNSIDGKWLYYDSTSGWILTERFDIADTNNLYYTKADQMLCIGGKSKALVVYRKYDSTEGKPDLYATLVSTDNTLQEVRLYDFNGAEETVGVRGAYGNGYFLVPLVSGSYLRYDVVSEETGTVYNRDYVTSNGEHPYAIYTGDWFVLAWIDHYNDADGEPKVANIDMTNFYIHPQYGVSVTGGDSYIDKHPLIAYYDEAGTPKLLYIWSNSSDGTTFDVKYAIVSLNTETDSPSIDSVGVLVRVEGDQRAHGLGVLGPGEYLVTYTCGEDGEEDYLAFLSVTDRDYINSYKLFDLPSTGSDYKALILDSINSAASEVFVAVAFFWEENPGAPGTISKALVDAKNRGVDVRVIIDDDDDNKPIYKYLIDNGVPVINDTSAGDLHIMHDKFMVVDSWKLIVASVNFIEGDFSKNNNTAIYLESKALANYYRNEFLHMWNDGNGRFGRDKILDNSFIAFTDMNGVTVVFEGYFSPQAYGDVARIPNSILPYLTKASESAYFAAYIFTTSFYVTPIYNALVDAYDNGLDVKGVFDEELNVDTPGKRLYWFIDEGVPVAIDNHPYKMHAKLLALDNKTAVLGSWNPTKSATYEHDENILVIREPSKGGIAEQIATYILTMYKQDVFVKAPYQYTPHHLVISKVYYYPSDDTRNPTYEWVEIYNPTSQDIDLTNYLIGDSESLLYGDDEGLYRFPGGSVIPANSYIVIAYNATAFASVYGFQPDYEIAGDDPGVPDLEPYNTSMFTGSWNLSNTGDEVILGYDSDGFIVVVDAVWWGDSPYMQTSIGRPNSAAPLDTSTATAGDGIVNKYLTGESTEWDAISMQDKYTVESNPQPIPEGYVLIGLALATGLVGAWLYRRTRLANKIFTSAGRYSS